VQEEESTTKSAGFAPASTTEAAPDVLFPVLVTAKD